MQHTENELYGEIERTLTAAAGEEKNRRIRALEQLLKTRLKDTGRAVELLCDLINKLGPIRPEITLVTRCLGRLARSSELALTKLVRLVEEHHAGAIQCGCRVLATLGVKAQVRLGVLLAKELLQRDASDSLTEALVTALKQLRHRDVKRVVTEELSRSLDSPDGLRIWHAVTILSQVGEKSVELAFVKILDKLLDGYYGGHADQIQKGVCSYFMKFPSESTVPGLLRGIEKQRSHIFVETVGAMCDSLPDIQEDLLRLARRTSDDGVRSDCLAALAAMQKTKPRVRDIVRIVRDGDLKYTSVRESFRQLLLKNSRESKPILLEMFHSNNGMWWEFALEVLKGMQVPMDQVSKAVERNPATVVYEYFFGGNRAELAFGPLWQAKANLGNSVKGKTTRFEHLLRNLLSCLGFITLDVDASGKAGVDTVAFPPTWSYVLLLGTTTGVVGDNLEKLANTTKQVRAALGEIARKIDILPVVATSLSEEINPKDEEYAGKYGIVILRQSDIDRLVEWVSTNRSYKKLVAYLEQKVGKGRKRSLFEILQRVAKSKRE